MVDEARRGLREALRLVAVALRTGEVPFALAERLGAGSPPEGAGAGRRPA